VPAPAAPKALLIDFGGVLTTSVFDSFRAFCVGEGLAPDRFPGILAEDPEAGAMFVAVEKGEIPEAEFERAFAPLLGPDVVAEGMLRRLTAALQPEPAMLDVVVALRATGVTTVVVSNSFGRHAYDDYRLEERFDHIVLSAEVGARKPAGAIYRQAIELAGCAPEQGVFVDDLEQNIVAARRAGLRGLLHEEPEATIAALGREFGLDLSPSPDKTT
jgi:putative hydrolase of the HAD superfamily